VASAQVRNNLAVNTGPALAQRAGPFAIALFRQADG
jgi:hypothetical protein